MGDQRPRRPPIDEIIGVRELGFRKLKHSINAPTDGGSRNSMRVLGHTQECSVGLESI